MIHVATATQTNKQGDTEMHAIEIKNGEHRFAYNGNNGGTWHGLGTRVEGYSTVSDMLVAAIANWQVEKQPLYVQAPNGIDIVEVPNKVATVRVEHTLTADGVLTEYAPLGVVGKDYAVEQNIDAAEWAVDLVGASGGDAIIDTMGVLPCGAQPSRWHIQPVCVSHDDSCGVSQHAHCSVGRSEALLTDSQRATH